MFVLPEKLPIGYLGTMPEPRTILPRRIRRYPELQLAVDDVLAAEEPLDVRLSEGGAARSVAITMRTPGDDMNLARGFLFTEGIIGARAQVQCEITDSNVVEVRLPPGSSIDWERLRRHSYTSSSCGVCGKTSLEQVYTTVPFPESTRPLTVEPAVLQQLPERLRQAQPLFAKTGGIHGVALFTPGGELLHVAEDVGRHNALDKLIGHFHATDSLPLDDHLLLLSGRASFELLQKAAMAGIRIVAAVGAPSSLAAAVAEEMDITLVGFLRPTGFNVYHGHERIAT